MNRIGRINPENVSITTEPRYVLILSILFILSKDQVLESR